MPAVKKSREHDENGEKMDAFAEVLRVMDIEQLIRFRRRLEKVGRKRMVEILTEEIDERDAEEKARSRTHQQFMEQTPKKK